MYMQTLILNLISAAAIAVIFVAARYIYKRQPVIEQPSDIITKMVSDFWNMAQEINAAKTGTELQAWYYEIEMFEDCYSGLVDEKLLRERVQGLYDRITTRRDQLAGVFA